MPGPVPTAQPTYQFAKKKSSTLESKTVQVHSQKIMTDASTRQEIHNRENQQNSSLGRLAKMV